MRCVRVIMTRPILRLIAGSYLGTPSALSPGIGAVWAEPVKSLPIPGRRGAKLGCQASDSHRIWRIPRHGGRHPVGDQLFLVVAVQVPWRLGEGLVGPAAHDDSVLLLRHCLDERAGLCL